MKTYKQITESSNKIFNVMIKKQPKEYWVVVAKDAVEAKTRLENDRNIRLATNEIEILNLSQTKGKEMAGRIY